MIPTEIRVAQSASTEAIAHWRVLLRAVKTARGAAYLGPKAAAGAAAVELGSANWSIRVTARAVLAGQAARNRFITDLRELERLLNEHDIHLQQTTWRPAARIVRSGVRRNGRASLAVEAARAVPLTALLPRYGVELRRSGRDFLACCPFHEDRRPSLRVSETKGLWYCFPCGIGGDGIQFVMRLRALDFATAVRELAA
jgi:hypothetical protein